MSKQVCWKQTGLKHSFLHTQIYWPQHSPCNKSATQKADRLRLCQQPQNIWKLSLFLRLIIAWLIIWLSPKRSIYIILSQTKGFVPFFPFYQMKESTFLKQMKHFISCPFPPCLLHPRFCPCFLDSFWLPSVSAGINIMPPRPIVLRKQNLWPPLRTVLK